MTDQAVTVLLYAGTSITYLEIQGCPLLTGKLLGNVLYLLPSAFDMSIIGICYIEVQNLGELVVHF